MSESIVPSLPEAKHFSEASIRVVNRLHNPDHVDRLLQFIHTPFLPGQKAYYGIGYTDHVIVSLFLEWPFTGRLGQLVKDVLMELDVPDEATGEDFEQALCRVAEKQLRLVRLYIKPLLDLLDKHGFEDARKRIDKAYLKDKLFSQDRDSQGRRMLRYDNRYAHDQDEKPSHDDLVLVFRNLREVVRVIQDGLCQKDAD